MSDCGKPGEAGAMESPTAGLSTRPRTRQEPQAPNAESPRHGKLWRARRGRHRGEPDLRPRDRALHEARAASPCGGEPAPRGSCGEPGGEGAVESPTAGRSTSPRDRALHEA
jgi:hypothetical protein